MLANAKKMVGSLTEVAIALLALAVVASLLVGPDNMAFFGGCGWQYHFTGTTTWWRRSCRLDLLRCGIGLVSTEISLSK